MSSTPDMDHYHQVTGPGGEKSGQELVKNLQAIEKDYSKAFEDILTINKEYGWCYSASLRLHEVEPELASNEKHLHKLELELASIPDVDRAWDNSKHRKPQIKAEIEQLQEQVSDLAMQKRNLSIRIEHAQDLYRSHSGGQGAEEPLLSYCSKVVAQIRESEKELVKYSTFVHSLKQSSVNRVEVVCKNFSRKQIASAEAILDDCHTIGQRAMQELQSQAQSAAEELAIPSPAGRLLSPRSPTSSFKRQVRDHIANPQPRRPSRLSSVLNVGNSLSKSILPSAGTYRKHMIYSQL